MDTSGFGLHNDPLYVKVYQLLRGWILDGRLLPGARIRETALAGELGVSRTPVRDALRHLERDRLILPIAGPAYEVYNPSSKDLDDLYAARAFLEGGAARLAAEQHATEVVQQLTDILAAMTVAYVQEPIGVTASLDAQFHETLVAASKNPVVVELHGHLSIRLRHIRSLSSDFAVRRQSVLEQHKAIIDALQSGSGEAAEQATRSHILFIATAARAGFLSRPTSRS